MCVIREHPVHLRNASIEDGLLSTEVVPVLAVLMASGRAVLAPDGKVLLPNVLAIPRHLLHIPRTVRPADTPKMEPIVRPALLLCK